jgi:hypothetical protein
MGAIVVAVVLAVCVFHEPRATPLMMGFLMVGALTAVAWSVRRNPWALADEVVDEGNCLVVRRRSVQARIAFDDIAEVDREATGFARHVRLTLARAIPSFGAEVVFRPRDYGSMTTKELNRLIEELRSRAPGAALSQHAPEQRNALPAIDGWASRRTLTQKRVILACAGLFIMLAAGNYLLGLKMFAPFDKALMGGCVAVGVIVMHFFAPTVAEMDEQIDAKIARKRLKRESR